MHAFTSTPRRLASAALAAAALSLVAACGNGSGDAVGGGDTAATVGSARISRATILGAVDRALAGETELTRQKLTEEHLTTQVKLALYESHGQKLGVGLTAEEQATTRAAFEEQTSGQGGLDKAAETSGIAKEDIGDVVDLVTWEKLLARNLLESAPVNDADLETLRATNPDLPKFEDQSTAAHILVKEEALAVQLLAEIKGGGDFAAIAAKHSLDPGSKGKGGELGPIPQPKGTYVPEFEAALELAKPGEVVGPVKTQYGYHLITITTVTGAQIKERVKGQAAPVVGRERLKELVRGGPEVKVNPRFGSWNAQTLTVVAADGGSDAPSSPSGAPRGQLQQQ